MRRTRPLAANACRRRFPPPWSVEELDACLACKVSAQALAYIYFLQAKSEPAETKLFNSAVTDPSMAVLTEAVAVPRSSNDGRLSSQWLLFGK
jgi:hypothetical protein